MSWIFLSPEFGSSSRALLSALVLGFRKTSLLSKTNDSGVSMRRHVYSLGPIASRHTGKVVIEKVQIFILSTYFLIHAKRKRMSLDFL
jgi:hypothetical protein